MFCKKVVSVFFIIISFSFSLFSTNWVIEGVVRDAKTREPLIGASVYIKNDKSLGTTTGFDGSFTLKNLKSNKVTLVCSYISYKTLEKEITISSTNFQKIYLDLVSYETELQDVIVTASSKTSDVGVRKLERISPNVMNIVGARSIEISPDLTVANVLGRISGVVMEKNNSGEAEYAVLRGMDKRYNITTVNNVKISSPNNRQRYVPLNIFPSELLDRLEVSKTRSAEIEGDATGGAVNMVMKDAPSRLSVKANIATGYNVMFFDRTFTGYDPKNIIKISPYERYGSSYSATITDLGMHVYAPINYVPLPNIVTGFSIGNRLLNKKLGYIFAGNYQNFHKGTNTTYFQDEMLQIEKTPRLTSQKERIYSEYQKQYGIHAKFDYNFDKNNSIEWYNFFVANDAQQVRQSTSTNFKLSYEPQVGTLDLSYQTRFRTTNTQIFASTLHGEHRIGNFFLFDWKALYSIAGLQRPDQIFVNIDNLRQNYIDNITIDGDGSDRRWEHNSDQDFSALFKLGYSKSFKRDNLKIITGGLFRKKMRDNFYVNYKIKPVDTNQSFETLDQINWSLYTPKGSVNQLNFNASELIAAGYIEGRYETSKFEFTLGARTEYTNQGYYMLFPNFGEPADGGQTYAEVLPNAQIKYILQEKQNFRVSYYKSVNRPGFFEIVPYQMQEEEYTEYGNKNLKHSTIDNVDLRWEYFPTAMDQILIGTFYKNIKNPIEYAYYSVNQRQSGYGLQNLGNAQNFGVEFDVIKYIRFLGIKANYTFTHSSITTPKVYYGIGTSGGTETLTKNQTRPLVGQAAHVANISLLIKDINHGWDAQLAASYSGDKIVIVSRFLDADYWEKASVNIDFSFEKSFKNGISIFGKANNLLNTPKTEYLKVNNPYNSKFPMQSLLLNETLIRKEYYKQSFLLGVRYKL